MQQVREQVLVLVSSYEIPATHGDTLNGEVQKLTAQPS